MSCKVSKGLISLCEKYNKKTADNRINTVIEKMKKLFLLFISIFVFSFAANAQADQCKLEGGNGGYIDAYVSSKVDMCTSNHSPSIDITTTPSVDQPSDGKVLVKVTYIRKEDGEKETITRSIHFNKSSSAENSVLLDSCASRIVSIEIWGAECKSASRSL